VAPVWAAQAVVVHVAPVWAAEDNKSLIDDAFLENCFQLPSDILIKQKKDKFLFLSPSDPTWVITNSNGAKLLKLCNGKRKLKDIASISSRFLGRDTAKEVIDYFTRVNRESRLFQCSKPTANNPSSNFLRTVHLNLTDACNLKCVYCYACERHTSKDEMTRDDYIKLIDSINDIQKKIEIVFTGGEPLLVDYCLEVAEYAKSKGNQALLLTNGVLINENNVIKISKLFDLIKISIDGSAAHIHDFHRGGGTYERVTKAVDLLIRNKAKVKISMTVTKKNIKDVGYMAKKFGSFLNFAPLFRAGRAKSFKGLSITGNEYYDCLSSETNIKPLSNLCSVLDIARNKRITKCAVGDSEISISSKGDVYPCHMLHLPQFLAGNIKNKSLKEIYINSESLKKCRNLDVSNVKGCKKCHIRFICGGACRARAYYETGHIDSNDHFCEYEKQAYINGLFDMYEMS
jgi:radical SAM protein with 4Fe4S-binding SPASM domain